MDKLTGKQRRFLASEAHHLEPVVMIGQKGLTEGLVDALNKALDDHELIKIKFQDFKDQKKEMTQSLAEQTDSEIIRTIGNITILYRMQRDPKKRRIFIP